MCESMVVLVAVKKKKKIWCGVGCVGGMQGMLGMSGSKKVQKRGLRGQASQLGGWKKGHWLSILGLGSNP